MELRRPDPISRKRSWKVEAHHHFALYPCSFYKGPFSACRLKMVPRLLSRHQRRQQWAHEVWIIRRSVLNSLAERVHTHAVRALVQLTDHMYTTRPSRCASTPRVKQRDALAATVFTGLPVSAEPVSGKSGLELCMAVTARVSACVLCLCVCAIVRLRFLVRLCVFACGPAGMGCT